MPDTWNFILGVMSAGELESPVLTVHPEMSRLHARGLSLVGRQPFARQARYYSILFVFIRGLDDVL